MIIASLAIYVSSSRFRKEDFYNRLRNKALNTATLLFNTTKDDANRVLKVEKNTLGELQNEKIIIINLYNDIVYSSDENKEIKVENDVLEKVRLGFMVTYKQEPYEIIGTLYFTDYDRFVIIAAATDAEGSLHLEKLKFILIIVCISSLLIFYIVGWFYSGQATKPIANIVKKVENISITSLNLRVLEGNGTDEIGMLARTFNKMLERLETSFAVQKDFIAHASHELRTPLTSINGQLEVLMMKDRSTDEYKSSLVSVLDDIKSLIDLSNRLLLMARTGAEGPGNLYKNIRIDEILWQVQEEMKKFNSEYQINISIDESLTDSDQMIVAGDEFMLKAAVSNIVDNACKYSPDNKVDIKLQHRDKWIEIIFEDRGIGISKDDLEKIFEPFYRAANTLPYSGSGIGLPLVNQIIKNHNGKIKLSSVIGKGTIFTVLLPTIS